MVDRDEKAAITSQSGVDAPTFNSRSSSFTLSFIVAIIVCLLYVGTLRQPFDFEDDGIFGYSTATDRSLTAMTQAVAHRTLDDFQTNGPFRPVIWLYFELQALCLGQNFLARHLVRMAFLFVSALTFCELMHSLKLPRIAMVFVAILCFSAPARSSIWYRFGLTEGIALPFVMMALYFARRACLSQKPWKFDIASIGCLLVSLLTKNVFVAILPVAGLLRIWRDGETLWRGIADRRMRLLLYAAPVIVPVLHFIAFKNLVQAHSSYHVASPGIQNLFAMLRSCYIAGGYEFLCVGVLIALAAVLTSPHGRQSVFSRDQLRNGFCCLLLFIAGVAIYLPVLGSNGPAGRYTIPAVLGLDLALAILIAGLMQTTNVLVKRSALTAFAVALICISGQNWLAQREFGGRCQSLWNLTQSLMAAPANSRVVVQEGCLSLSEAIHMNAHLAGLGRNDIVIERKFISPTENLASDCLIVTRENQKPDGGFVLGGIFTNEPLPKYLASLRGKGRRSFGVALWMPASAANPNVARAKHEGDAVR